MRPRILHSLFPCTPLPGTLLFDGSRSSSSSSAADEASPAPGTTGNVLPAWCETKEQIDRGMLMERDPIIFYDEVVLFESDLDDSGERVCLRVALMTRDESVFEGDLDDSGECVL